MSHHHQPVPEGKDPALWEIANKRADFKTHLMSYIIWNAFMWGVWFFTCYSPDTEEYFPWPAWSMFVWGIGLAYHYAEAYIFPIPNSVEKEYQKLKNIN